MAKNKLRIHNVEVGMTLHVIDGTYKGAEGIIVGKTTSYVTVEIDKKTVSPKTLETLPKGWKEHYNSKRIYL